jgi:hypothetical protein
MDIQGRVVDWDCMSGRSELTRGLKALTLLVLDPQFCRSWALDALPRDTVVQSIPSLSHSGFEAAN